VHFLDVNGRHISDLKGIEAFINLDTLLCASNQIKSLDVSENTALKTLNCIWNQISNLDVSNIASLTYLCCHFNQLTFLNISDNS
jgi:Leucine-rich repeat (LRR) protein